LRAIGVTETIAATVDDYVAIAARLARDRPWRAQITNRMRTNRHRAWRDAAAIKGLEAWLERVVRGPPPPS
jgi:predicted O-linked N-acetylglucosamine transferase (SPINDLY family)